VFYGLLTVVAMFPTFEWPVASNRDSGWGWTGTLPNNNRHRGLPL